MNAADSFLEENQESPTLSAIEQLTTEEMGFDKAGEAYFSPCGTMISFQAVPKGEKDYQIYIMDLNTRNIREISQHMGACTCSFFRPDGKKIIFAGSHLNTPEPTGGGYKWDLTPYMNIYETDLDGSSIKAITTGSAYHAECAYSPDGKEIVYASNEDGCMNLYIINSDGTNKRQITHDTHCYNGGPFFSPDGEQIIFRADKDKPHYLQIYIIDKDGQNLRQMTQNHAVNWAPFWHPSKKGFAYTTSIHGHHAYEIYYYSFNSCHHYRLTYHKGFDGLPSFDASGTKMLWTSKRGRGNTSQVFIANFNIEDFP